MIERETDTGETPDTYLDRVSGLTIDRFGDLRDCYTVGVRV